MIFFSFYIYCLLLLLPLCKNNMYFYCLIMLLTATSTNKNIFNLTFVENDQKWTENCIECCWFLFECLTCVIFELLKHHEIAKKKLELHSKQHEINPNMNFFAVVCMRLNSSWNLVDILLTDADWTPDTKSKIAKKLCTCNIGWNWQWKRIVGCCFLLNFLK